MNFIWQKVTLSHFHFIPFTYWWHPICKKNHFYQWHQSPNEGKFVLSYSSSKPHLVFPSNTSVFVCDSECPNWKGLGICAHSVAVTEMNGKLSDNIEKVKKKKKTPNITKLAEATIPKGRGRKGSEDPRKRKRNSTVETHLENPSLIHVQLLTKLLAQLLLYQKLINCHQPIFLLIIIAKHHPTSTNRKQFGAQLNIIIHLSYFVKYQAT